jgi:cytochrome c-type biogenesis protein CcsB
VSSQSLAALSNALVYSAMTVYALAMVAFAAEWAFGTRSRLGRQAADLAAVPAARTVPASSAARRGGGTTTVTRAAPSVDPPRLGTSTGGGRAARLGRVAVALTVLAFGLHLGGVVARGLAAGRVPWGNMYEFSTAGALAAVGIWLALLSRRDVRWLGLFVVTAALLTLGLAVTVLYVDAEQLVPALRSYWLAIHVLAAVISSGALAVGALTTVAFLVVDRYERRGAARPAALGMLPDAASLDRLAYRVHAFTFPLWTFAVVAGAIWAENAWGRYWGWDPKETWAFITWVIYAAYLHARATAGVRGRTAAAIALLGFAAFLFNYFGVNIFISGLHSYAGV